MKLFKPKDTVEHRLLKQTMGEPKSLEAAITYALMIGPLSGARERAIENVKTFLAAKFQDAITKSDDKTAQAILDLWCVITGEKPE